MRAGSGTGAAPCRRAAGATLLVVVGLAVSGCTETRYVGLDQARSFPAPHVRTVGVALDRAFIDDYPDCVVVMPPAAAPGLEALRPIVERALAVHMTRKLSRVVDGAARDLAARRLGLDLFYPEDRRALAQAAGCDTLMYARIVGPGWTYLVLWSGLEIGIEAELVRVRDLKVLWQARHVARRSEGGFPLGPAGAAVNAVSSARFSADREIADSVVDDAIRRIVASLPDARTPR